MRKAKCKQAPRGLLGKSATGEKSRSRPQVKVETERPRSMWSRAPAR